MAQFGSTFELSDLNGENGLIINGENDGDWLGAYLAHIGDVNDDGINDILVSAPGAEGGKAYVIYGNSQGYSSPFDLSSLNGNNGFVINNTGSFNRTSKAGDINGDKIDDIIIGGVFASHVIFGRDTAFTSELDTADLNGSNGFVINGYVQEFEDGYRKSSGGDLNGDGLNDVVIATNGDSSDKGIVYVLFGSDQPYSASVDISLVSGSNGFIINGQNDNDRLGRYLSIVGDINNDGIDDLSVSKATQNDEFGNDIFSDSYVIFGSGQPFMSNFDLSTLNGSNGFKIPSIDSLWLTSGDGANVNAAGDINHDGIDDLVIGYGGVNNGAGQAYVIYGKSEAFNASFDLSSLNGTNGFSINSLKNYGFVGARINTIGDVNADGVDDIMLLALQFGESGENYITSYVIYGSEQLFPSNFDLSSINGANGFAIKSFSNQAFKGISSISSPGDFNNDGIDDMLVGVLAEGENNSETGAAYIIYGRGDLIFDNGFED